MDDALRGDPEIVKHALLHDKSRGRHIECVLSHATEPAISDRDVIRRACQHPRGLAPFVFASPSLRNDAAFCLEMVAIDSANYVAVSDTLKATDRDLAVAATKRRSRWGSHGFKLQMIPLPWRMDREVVLQAVSNDISVYHELDDFVKNDDAIASAALKANICLFPHVPEQFRAQRSIALRAVRNNAAFVQHVAPELVADRSFLLRCVRANPDVLINIDVWDDVDMVAEAFAKGGTPNLARVIPAHLQDNTALMRPMSCSGWLSACSERLRDDDDFVRDAVRACGSNFRSASNRLRAEPEFLLLAARTYCFAVSHVDERLRLDRDLMLQVATINGAMFRYMDKAMKEDRAVAYAAVGTHLRAVDDMASELQSDLVFVQELVERNWRVFNILNGSYRDMRHLALAAVRGHPDALKRASVRLRRDPALLLCAARTGEEAEAAVQSARDGYAVSREAREAWVAVVAERWSEEAPAGSTAALARRIAARLAPTSHLFKSEKTHRLPKCMPLQDFS